MKHEVKEELPCMKVLTYPCT